MTPAERRELDALKAQLAALSRQVGNARGLGVNTAFGATHYRTTQLGFPAELTTDYDEAAGYGWKRRRLVPGLAEPFTDPAVQPRGDKAFSFVGDRTLVAGTDGWMEPSPDASGYVFVHRYSQSGSGADDGGGGGCDLETVSFDVVTAVSCDDSGGLTVTTRRVSITGCNLSVSSADAPPVIGPCDGAGEALAGYPNLTLTGVTGGPLTLEYSGGQYRVDTNGDPDGWRLAYSGGAWTLTEVQDGALVRSGAATAGACSPFSLTFAGSDFGLVGSITVGL